jgi:hypothetical protein
MGYWILRNDHEGGSSSQSWPGDECELKGHLLFTKQDRKLVVLNLKHLIFTKLEYEP